MKLSEKRQKLFDFITTWQDAVYNDEEEASRFYTYLGDIIQSKLVRDFVHLKDNCPEGYEVAGDIPLMEYIRDYDLDGVYNDYFKQHVSENRVEGDL